MNTLLSSIASLAFALWTRAPQIMHGLQWITSCPLCSLEDGKGGTGPSSNIAECISLLIYTLSPTNTVTPDVLMLSRQNSGKHHLCINNDEVSMFNNSRVLKSSNKI